MRKREGIERKIKERTSTLVRELKENLENLPPISLADRERETERQRGREDLYLSSGAEREHGVRTRRALPSPARSCREREIERQRDRKTERERGRPP